MQLKKYIRNTQGNGGLGSNIQNVFKVSNIKGLDVVFKQPCYYGFNLTKKVKNT